MSNTKNVCPKTDCVYRAAPKTIGTCDFRTIMGVGRGCPIEGCVHYKSGVRKAMRPDMSGLLREKVEVKSC